MLGRQIDVCVVGGGPAGSSVALRMVQLGYEVCLLEAAPFPRSQVAASLTPNCLVLLEAIGARRAIEAAGFTEACARAICWGPEIVLTRSNNGGLHVDRERFDLILLQLAKSSGVRVIQPAQAQEPVRTSDGGWSISFRTSSGTAELTCAVWIDATGRQSAFCRRKRFSPATMAVYGYWHIDDLDGTAHLRAGDEGWSWLAPAGRKDTWIGLVVAEPKALLEKNRSGVATYYRERLCRAFPERSWADACALSSVRVCDASTRASNEDAGSGFVRVGDASLCVDPLSSQGIQLAISSATQGAAVVNTFLRTPKESDTAISFYRSRQMERRAQHLQTAAALYANVARVNPNRFWRERALRTEPSIVRDASIALPGSDTVVRIAANLQFECVPVLQNDLITNSLAVRSRTDPRPVAFVAGHRLVDILRRLVLPSSIDALRRQLKALTSERLGSGLAEWLWEQQIIVAASSELESGIPPPEQSNGHGVGYM